MTTIKVQGGLSPRKKIFDITVAAGGSEVISPGAINFNIVAAAVSGAGTYSIEFACTEELDDWRALNNSESNPSTGLSNGGTLAARTTVVYSPGVQKLRFSATTNPARFIAYGA